MTQAWTSQLPSASKPASQQASGQQQASKPSQQAKPASQASKPSQQASKPASKPASQPASQQASKPASQHASKPARQQASTPARQHASMQARKHASTQTCKHASTQACKHATHQLINQWFDHPHSCQPTIVFWAATQPTYYTIVISRSICKSTNRPLDSTNGSIARSPVPDLDAASLCPLGFLSLWNFHQSPFWCSWKCRDRWAFLRVIAAGMPPPFCAQLHAIFQCPKEFWQTTKACAVLQESGRALNQLQHSLMCLFLEVWLRFNKSCTNYIAPPESSLLLQGWCQRISLLRNLLCSLCWCLMISKQYVQGCRIESHKTKRRLPKEKVRKQNHKAAAAAGHLSQGVWNTIPKHSKEL